MQPIASVVLYLLLAISLNCCQRITENPPDLKQKVLDPGIAIQEADVIVLAYPISQRNIGNFLVREPERKALSRLRETETTLQVLHVFKGSALPGELHFRHYVFDDYILFGPPQGSSGDLGSIGIFFLRNGLTGIARSFVDVYRPDIATPWVHESPANLSCIAASDCIARFLLTFREGDNAASFSAALAQNAMIARQITGFLETFELLNKPSHGQTPEPVAHSMCTALSEMYVLEFPERCRTLIAGTPAGKTYAIRAVQLREKLRQGGGPWLQDRLRTKEEATIIEDLQLITKSAEPETRRLAEELLKSLTSPGHSTSRSKW